MLALAGEVAAFVCRGDFCVTRVVGDRSFVSFSPSISFSIPPFAHFSMRISSGGFAIIKIIIIERSTGVQFTSFLSCRSLRNFDSHSKRDCGHPFEDIAAFHSLTC